MELKRYLYFLARAQIDRLTYHSYEREKPMSERDLQALDAYFVTECIRHLEEYHEFLRIPSVSALPSHKEDMIHAADWVASALRSAGVPTVEILPTQGHPVVYGAW